MSKRVNRICTSYGSEYSLVWEETQQSVRYPTALLFAFCFLILLGTRIFIFTYGLNTFLLREQLYLWLQSMGQGVGRNGTFPLPLCWFVFRLFWLELLTPLPHQLYHDLLLPSFPLNVKDHLLIPRPRPQTQFCNTPEESHFQIIRTNFIEIHPNLNAILHIFLKEVVGENIKKINSSYNYWKGRDTQLRQLLHTNSQCKTLK